LRAKRQPGDTACFHGRAIRFGGLLGLHPGRSSSQCETVSRTSDTSVATFVVRRRSRGHPPYEHRQERLSFHPREQADDPCDPRCLPSFKDLCPAAPFRMPGSGLPQVHSLAAVTLPLAASFANNDPCGSSNARFPSTRPVCRWESRFSKPRWRLPTSAT